MSDSHFGAENPLARDVAWDVGWIDGTGLISRVIAAALGAAVLLLSGKGEARSGDSSRFSNSGISEKDVSMEDFEVSVDIYASHATF